MNSTIIDDFISLKDREFYGYYKKNRICISKGVERYADWTRAVARIMRSIGELIVTTEGGVYIENWGYFAIFKTYKKTDKKVKNLSITSYIKDYRYYPYFFGEVGRPCFKNWFMAMTFNKKLREKIKHKVGSGFKYKLFLTTIKSLIGANKETRRVNK